MESEVALRIFSWDRFKTLGQTLIGRTAKEETLGSPEIGFRRLVQNAPDVIMVVEADLTVSYASPSVERVLGHSPEKFVGVKAFEYALPKDPFIQMLHHPPGRQEAPMVISAPLEFRMRHADGSWRDVEVTAVDLSDGPDLRKACYVRDITMRKSMEDKLTSQALRDPLTGLANRSLLVDRLEHALSRYSRHREPITAVLFLDLDNFKAINNNLGHEAGDELLVTVAQRLQACIRPADTLARFGGDEFVILLEDIKDASNSIRLAERIAEMLQAPIALDRHMLFITTSIGVSVSATSGSTLARAENLLRAADLAMYRAKQTGKIHYEVFEDNISAEGLERMELENDLWRALEREQFRAYYQPYVSLESCKAVGMEALLRWEHPQRGLISPDEFISLVEKTGMIVPVGQWILEEACHRAKEWHEQYPDRTLLICVNLSARQFQQPDLTERIAEILRQTGLDPQTLVLEITESTLVGYTQNVTDMLHKLKELGVKLAIDDFGTGYSSLSYLQRLPLDYLKIDQSFVEALSQEKEGNTKLLVSTVLGLAKALDIEAVAEGVETTEQVEELRKMGCEFGQGYYFSEPLSDSMVSALLGSL